MVEETLAAICYAVMIGAALFFGIMFVMLIVCLHDDVFGVQYKDNLEDQEDSNKEEEEK